MVISTATLIIFIAGCVGFNTILLLLLVGTLCKNNKLTKAMSHIAVNKLKKVDLSKQLDRAMSRLGATNSVTEEVELTGKANEINSELEEINKTIEKHTKKIEKKK